MVRNFQQISDCRHNFLHMYLFHTAMWHQHFGLKKCVVSNTCHFGLRHWHMWFYSIIHFIKLSIISVYVSVLVSCRCQWLKKATTDASKTLTYTSIVPMDLFYNLKLCSTNTSNLNVGLWHWHTNTKLTHVILFTHFRLLNYYQWLHVNIV